MSVKAAQINNTTLYPHKGSVVCMTGDDESSIKQLAICDPMWANLLSGSAVMFSNLQTSMQFNEAMLEVLENQGLDKLAHSLTKLIAAQKLIEKRILQGPEALTAIVSKPK